MEPDFSDMAPTQWTITLRVTGFGDIVGDEPEVRAQQEWKGSGETIKDALIAVGKNLRTHVSGELFVSQQKCADAELALREMDRDLGDIWTDPAEAEKALEESQG